VEIITSLWLGMPVWVWLSFLATVLAILAFDLGVLHKETHEIEVKESLWMSSLYIGLGLFWAVAVWWIYYMYGGDNAIDPQIAGLPTPEAKAWEAVKLYLTGYLVEKTLAMDNVFIISMIFAYFAVPRIYQHRVLFWGILGVIVLRAIMIGLGAALVMEFAWIMYFFAVILIATGVKMIVMMDQKPDIAKNPVLLLMKRKMNVTNEVHGEKFWVKLPVGNTGRMAWFATPLFLCLVLVEIADVVFAIDSVPAIFAITPDPFIVYTSNIFAILGLRALYFALAAMVHRFHYLKYALAIVLIFIGAKIFLGDILWDGKMPAELSLGITASLLFGGVLYSLWKTRGSAATDPSPIGSGGGSVPETAGAMSVGQAMTREFVSVPADASIGEAATLMTATRTSALVVMDADHRLRGLVTDGDLLRREELGTAPTTELWRTLFSDDKTLARAFAKAYGRRVETMMSKDLKTVTEDMPLAEAAQLLFVLGVKTLPVVGDGKLVGILSRSDIVRTLGRLGSELTSSVSTDAEIVDAIGTRISRSGWLSPQQVGFDVNEGAVSLRGTLSSDDQHAALVALVEGVPGVRTVDDAKLTVSSALVSRPV
jgi:tellurite resistance protein TerC